MTGPFNDDDLSFEASQPFEGTPQAPSPFGVTIAQTTPSSRADQSKSQANVDIDGRSNVITARGTSEGLVLRVDGRVDEADLKVATREFLESRRSFLQGNDVAFEWVGRKPSDELVSELSDLLSSEYKVTVRSSKLRTAAPKQAVAENTSSETGQQSGLSIFGGNKLTSTRTATPHTVERNVSLFDGIDTRSGPATNPMLWDEPDTRIIYGTLRSGQKVETEHSIIIFGDVNSGAEVIAGGDIVILGTLRGIAHAGAYDETGGGRVIFSLNLQPTQLRIGLVISRGSGAEHLESTPRGGIPEIARVESNLIVVEPYQSRTVWVRRRE